MITKTKPVKLAALTAVVILLAACGQKGALYLHKEDKKPTAKTEQVKTEQSEQDKNNTEQ